MKTRGRQGLSRCAIGVVGLVAAVCVLALFLWVRPQENIHAMIPASLQEQIELFEKSPLNSKFFITAAGADAEANAEAISAVQESLLREKLIQPPFSAGAEMGERLFKALPFRFLPSDEQAALALLQPENARAQMQKNYERLLSFESFIFRPLIQLDPFNFTSLMARKLAGLGEGLDLQYQGGVLTAKEGEIQIGVFDMSRAPDFHTVKKIEQIFAQVRRDFPAAAELFYMGSVRYTAENIAAIRGDLLRVTLLGLFGLGLVFAAFLRDRRALIIYLLPVLVLPPAALVTWLIFGNISGITLGFGSVVMGLSLDYAVYVFFAMRQANGDLSVPFQLRKHLLCNYTTSCLCFFALLFSSVELFRQLAVFSISGLTVALVLALKIFPPFWTNLSAVSSYRLTIKPLAKKAAVVGCVLAVLAGMYGITHLSAVTDLESLSASSPLFRRHQQILREVLGAAEQENALLFVKGKTEDEALTRNEEISARLPRPLVVSELFPSVQARRQHVAHWQAFWKEHSAQAKKIIVKETTRLKMAPQSFDPFFNYLEQVPQKDTLDVSAFYNPVVSLSDGSFAIANRVPNTPIYRQLADKENVVFLSAEEIQHTLLTRMRKEALKIVLLALFFNLIAALAVLRSIKKTLLAFLPVLVAACITFALLAVVDIKINLFILVFLPLLMGLGIDYGLFQVLKCEEASRRPYYPQEALLTAALSTLAGFGVLITARHGVLFMMGLSSFLGVGGALITAVFVLPSFLEEN